MTITIDIDELQPYTVIESDDTLCVSADILVTPGTEKSNGGMSYLGAEVHRGNCC